MCQPAFSKLRHVEIKVHAAEPESLTIAYAEFASYAFVERLTTWWLKECKLKHLEIELPKGSGLEELMSSILANLSHLRGLLEVQINGPWGFSDDSQPVELVKQRMKSLA